MNKPSRQLFVLAIAIATICPLQAHAGPAMKSLTEDSALDLLLRTLKHDQVYVNRISLDCVNFMTEEKRANYFQFVLRENHTAKCGGDPHVSPVVDRYRVHRASGEIERLDVVEDNWQPYNAKVR